MPGGSSQTFGTWRFRGGKGRLRDGPGDGETLLCGNSINTVGSAFVETAWSLELRSKP